MALPGGLPSSERSCKMWLSWAFQILGPFKTPNSRREKKRKTGKRHFQQKWHSVP